VVNPTPHDDILEEIKRDSKAERLYGPFGFSKEATDEYVARWKEIQEKYQPDFMWIDDIPIFTRDGNNTQVEPKVFKPEIQYFYDQCRLMITNFMNDASQRNHEVYMNNKGKNRNWPDGIGCLEKDNLKLTVIGPKWQSCTTFGTSFGYLENDKYKSPESIISEMVEVVSRNGNFLINIGPKADGSIVQEQLDLLHDMGNWLKINGDAIYGTSYWKVNHQEIGNLAFTTKGKKLYAIALEKPTSPIVIEASKGWNKEDVTSVKLLGSGTEIMWNITPEGLEFIPPANLGKTRYAWSFEIETNSEQHTPNAIQSDANKALEEL
jgi:alpha-L-fucosidase